MKITTFACFLFLVTFLFVRKADACICNLPPPPCYEFWRTDAVFAGKVKKVDEGTSANDSRVIVDVVENFRGMDQTRAVTGNYPTSCSHHFAEGESYLFYAALGKFYSALGENDGGSFGTSLCTRTTRLSDDLVDLEFLRAVQGGKSNYWIWGTISKGYEYDTPLKGIRAEVLGKNSRLAGVSDDAGNLKIVVPTAGKYKVRVYLPKGALDVNGLMRNETSLSEMQRKQIVGGKLSGRSPFLEYELEVQENKCGWFDVSIPR